MRTKKFWGMFYFSDDAKWHPSAIVVSVSGRRDDVKRLAEEFSDPHITYTAISGTVRPDGSISWPKKWPAP